MKRICALLLMLALPLQALGAVACIDSFAVDHAMMGHADHGTHTASTDDGVDSHADTHISAHSPQDSSNDGSGCDCCFSCHGGALKALVAPHSATALSSRDLHLLSASARFDSADPQLPEHVPLLRLASPSGRA